MYRCNGTKEYMARITFSTPAGPFSTGVPDVARMFLRSPEMFGHGYGEALGGMLDEQDKLRIAQHIEQAAAHVNGHREEIATGVKGLFVHVEPMFHSDSWRPR